MPKILKIGICVLLCAAVLIPPSPSYAQGGITGAGTEEDIKTSLGLYGRIKGFFIGAEKLAEEGKDIKEQIQETANAQSWSSKLGSVWEGVKSFFSDKTVRDMLVETGKLFLRLVANIFTLIAGVINKVLGTTTNNG